MALTRHEGVNMKPKTVRIEVEKPDQHLIDCHMFVGAKKDRTIRIKRDEFVLFLERLSNEVYTRGSQIEELTIRLTK